jgi:hypothetical protein
MRVWLAGGGTPGAPDNWLLIGWVVPNGMGSEHIEQMLEAQGPGTGQGSATVPSLLGSSE